MNRFPKSLTMSQHILLRWCLNDYFSDIGIRKMTYTRDIIKTVYDVLSKGSFTLEESKTLNILTKRVERRDLWKFIKHTRYDDLGFYEDNTVYDIEDDYEDMPF